MYLTKSDYLLFKQCPKSFWLQKNKREVMEISDSNDVLEKGNEVTKAARTLFSGGTLVEYSSDIHEMLQKTHELIKNGVRTIYEATFMYDDLLVICDILHRKGEVWSIYEVKSSTDVKERHLDDIAFQFYVVGNNLPVESVSLIHINKNYIRTGELDVRELFKMVDQTETIMEKALEVPFLAGQMKEVIDEADVKMEIGEYCNKYGKDAFKCSAKGYCWSHIPDYSVFDISNIRKKAFELYHEGVTTLDSIPSNYKLTDLQQIQVQAYKDKKSIIDVEKIKEHLSSFTFPLYFLDFETFQQSIPLFDYVKAYQQIPFQYSLHILLDDDKPLIHKEFLGKEGMDPRRSFAENLVRDIPKGVTTVTYNMSFEKTVLRNLSELFPDLSEHLMAIHDGVVDLMVPFQKKWFYVNEMKGSHSIKYVLPALLPNDKALDYKSLNIQNGSMAMNVYAFLHTFPREEIEKIRNDLLAYCHLDTLAMVKIWEFLLKTVSEEE